MTDIETLVPEPEASSNIEIGWLKKPMLVIEIFCGVLLVALTALVAVQALARHTVEFTPPGLYELIRLMLVYLVCLGAIVTYYRGLNLAVSGRWRQGTLSFEIFVFIIAMALTMISFVFMSVLGFAPSPASLLKLPQATGFIPVVLFAIGTALVSIARIVAVVKEGSRS